MHKRSACAMAPLSTSCTQALTHTHIHKRTHRVHTMLQWSKYRAVLDTKGYGRRCDDATLRYQCTCAHAYTVHTHAYLSTPRTHSRVAVHPHPLTYPATQHTHSHTHTFTTTILRHTSYTGQLPPHMEGRPPPRPSRAGAAIPEHQGEGKEK